MIGKDPAAQVKTLRKFRVAKPVDRSLKATVEALTKDLVKAARARGGMDGAWAELVPPTLESASWVEKLTPGGILCVRVRDAATRYELEVWLRSGGLDALRARCSTTLRRVKMEVRK
ncbi:MAG: DciA family protein [Planctomycetota bacterium]|nr:DciA family protein [Planctomycetota bacterium]